MKIGIKGAFFVAILCLFFLSIGCYGQEAEADSISLAENILAFEKKYPLVSPEEYAVIAPIIEKWTDYYNIYFAQARLVERRENNCLNCQPSNTTSLIYREHERDVYYADNRLGMDYSPDRQRYVDLAVTTYSSGGEYYYQGVFDWANVAYLFDRKQRYANEIRLNEWNSQAEAIFWKSNDVFVIVGYEEMQIPLYFVHIYDIAQQTITCYAIATEQDVFTGDYINDVYLKELSFKDRQENRN